MRDRPIKDTLLRLFGGLGIDIVDRTGYSELEALIRSLQPLQPLHSGVELIRLGPDGDGGYLLPDDLDGIEYAFSPGVSTESGFEAALADSGLRVFLADYSVDRPARMNANFIFDKKFIGCLSNDTFITLDQWKNGTTPDYHDDLLLQMDIDGAEFEALLSISAELLSQFRIMIIEFHYLQELLNKPYFTLSSRVF